MHKMFFILKINIRIQFSPKILSLFRLEQDSHKNNNTF